MQPSKATQKMLAASRTTNKGAASNTTVTDFSFSAVTMQNGRASPTITGVPMPRNPMGTTAPSRSLPVKSQRLPGDAIAGAAAASTPIPVTMDEELLPHAAAHMAANNLLATRATRSEAMETVVRSSESPLLFGPAASNGAAKHTMVKSSSYRSAGATPAPATTSATPAPGGQPPRPPSQQAPRPTSAKASTAEDGDTTERGSVLGGAYPDFAAELEAIGRAHRTEAAMSQKGRHRAAMAQAAALRQSLGGPSPAPSPSPSLGAGAGRGDETFTAEDFEAYDRLAGPPPRRQDEDPVEDEGRTATGKPLHVLYTPDIRARLPPGTAAHTMVQPKPMTLSDYRMLAEACQRAGRARTEAHAYYKMGELLSLNKDSRATAVTYFKRYLNLARRLNDLQGEAKALNCLGVVHHELGGDANLAAAIEYHQQHAAIADAAGVFIANTNMGLAYRKLGDAAAALQCFKSTLKYAVRAGDRVAESLALANLGQAGSASGDYATARVCVERHLELSSALQDGAASCEAHEQLGTLAAQRGDFAAATHSFTLALEAALADGDQGKARALRCQIGVVQGLLKAEQALANRALDMGAGVTM